MFWNPIILAWEQKKDENEKTDYPVSSDWKTWNKLYNIDYMTQKLLNWKAIVAHYYDYSFLFLILVLYNFGR